MSRCQNPTRSGRRASFCTSILLHEQYFDNFDNCLHFLFSDLLQPLHLSLVLTHREIALRNNNRARTIRVLPLPRCRKCLPLFDQLCLTSRATLSSVTSLVYYRCSSKGAKSLSSVQFFSLPLHSPRLQLYPADLLVRRFRCHSRLSCVIIVVYTRFFDSISFANLETSSFIPPVFAIIRTRIRVNSQYAG